MGWMPGRNAGLGGACTRWLSFSGHSFTKATSLPMTTTTMHPAGVQLISSSVELYSSLHPSSLSPEVTWYLGHENPNCPSPCPPPAAAPSGAAATTTSSSSASTTAASAPLNSMDTDAPLESSSAPPAPSTAMPASHPLSCPSHLHTSSAPIPTPNAPAPLQTAAVAAASWVFGSPPQSSAAAASTPVPNVAAMGSPGGPGGTTTPGGLPLAPVAPSSLPTGVTPEWAAGQQTLLVRGGEVPKDPLAALKQQYDSLVGFMLRVQNVLDDFAGAMERWQVGGVHGFESHDGPARCSAGRIHSLHQLHGKVPRVQANVKYVQSAGGRKAW